MPVISPRRSSTSGSSSLYGTTTSARATGGDSSTTAATSSTAGTNRYSSYYDRAGSLPKFSISSVSSYSPSSYSSSYSSYSSSSYIPRTPAYRSSSSSASSYLTGGSSALENYRRTSVYLDNNDSTSYSRYGLRKPKSYNDDNKSERSTSSGVVRRRDETKKPPTGASSSSSSNSTNAQDNKRLSTSCSASSLARLVATSGLDIYEKYSPAHYKPSTELPRSRSALSETAVNSAAGSVNDDNEPSADAERVRRRNEATSVATVTLDRPRSSRYSRLYSNGDDYAKTDEVDNTANTTIATISTRRRKPSNSTAAAAAGDEPTATATFTLRSRSKAKTTQNDDNNATNTETTKTLKKSTTKTTKKKSSDVDDLKIRNGITIIKPPPNDLCNGVADSLATATKSQLKLSASTSALNNEHENDRGIARSASDNGNLGVGGVGFSGSKIGSAAGGGGSSGDVSTTNSFNLEVPSLNATSSAVASKSKIRSSATTKSVLPPASPTASRYWDRDSSRTSSLSTLSTAAHNSLDADKASHDEKSEGLCGLRNIGNTCFMNSIIQCLSHTNELTRFLRNYNNGKSSSSLSSSSTKDQLILQEFAKLIREMWTSSVHSVTPMDLKRAFSAKHRMYSDYNQQDAQEFLRFFLDSLHSALNSGVKGETLRIDDNMSDNKKADLTWDWYTRFENSLIRDLFVGQLKSTLRCTVCGNTSVTFDPFWDLSVSLPSSSRCRLDACLDMFIREEVLDGDEMPTCSKCKTRRKCTKSFSIQRFPKYLVIHLKRFSETRWSKLSSIVEFPTGERELNMGPYGANPNSNIHYSLYAISNHMGSTAGGHYVALCKHPVSRKWHEFNDNVVSDTLSESHLVTSSAYILFYERA